MKRLLLITALLPFAVLAQPINTLNNPNQPGYKIPSQQRMQTQMQTQQIQQQGMLKQQMQTQARSQQQNLQSQLNANTQRVQPGNGMLGQQTLPNTQGGMLSGSGNPDRMLNHSQPMLQQGSGTPQPDIPLKTISP
ncbi:DUF2756 family protein [Salmonella enterica subsp. enterica serovar Javiana]|nr:DUF2756 family protein [Salmonella enterica]ECI5990126.1 DUF2756 family protein [Salmonella enterica subsp. enterica]EDN4769020.1 DUF2756 family protein [Salmonella enterica subsp. enterica serovar Javiana]EHA0435315.1 DUF2756 family protein [Salmonella enterica subsp. enterica serovar Agona]EDS5710172.1 DUF2756 family protein [Salmonella enterica subsp. enterica serovar Javiana]